MTDSTRLETRFADLRARNEAGLVIFVTAGDPNPETFDRILDGLPAAGADIIEIGMPFSDPMADGPAIQLANLRALDAGMNLTRTIEAVVRFRKRNSDTPIVLMGYYNPIHAYGVQRFLEDAKAAGVDGLILVDLPPEEDDELCHPALTAGIHWVRLTTPTSDDERLPVILGNASGFVYHVSVAGITGSQQASDKAIAADIARIRQYTELPIAVGFGIRTPDQAALVAAVADAVVVGSAVVDQVKASVDANGDADDCARRVHNLVAALSEGVHTARR